MFENDVKIKELARDVTTTPERAYYLPDGRALAAFRYIIGAAAE